MTRRRSALAALLLAATMLHPPHARAFGDTTTGAPCGITANGQANNNNIYCGLTKEELIDLIKAATGNDVASVAKELARVSTALGVTQEAARSLLRIVGEEKDIPPEKLGEALSRVAQDYKRLLAQAAALNPDNPTAKALVDKARTEIDAGRFKEARELLRQATATQVAAAQQARALAEQARAAEEAQLLGAAESTALAGDVALTQRDYLAAADLFRQAAGFLPPGREALRLGYLDREADALDRQGDERGDNAALLTAIKRYEDLLRLRPRDKSPDAWAMTQNNLAIALVRLGQQESSAARLEQAVKAFNAALLEYTRERVPLDWAMTQNNLGATLRLLSERESSTARLEQAVETYNAVLLEHTRERVPLQWAGTKNNLGIALARLGERESDPARLEQAVAAFNAALLERTRERAPRQWADTQNNLGIALLAIIKLTGDMEKLPALLTAWRGAAEVFRQAGMLHKAEPLERTVQKLETMLAGAAK
jgi:tetratricopeptide (TPR) repeat protein